MESVKKQTHYDSMLVALVPVVICATVMYSARVLMLCAVAMLTARIIDVAISRARNMPVDVDDKSSTVAAVVFVMMMPVSIPVYVIVMTVAIVTLIGKHAFGGKGAYPFNLSALSMCIAAVNWPDKVFVAVKPFASVDFWTGACASTATQSSTIKAGGLPYVDMLDLLTGNYAGSMGSQFVLLTVVIAVCLIVMKKITWHVPVTFVGVCTVIAFIFPRIYGISRINSVKLEILSSSLVFYALFMLCEPATTPKTTKAKIVFGVVAGVLTMLYRYFGSYEVGACFSILLVNATESFWDRLLEGDFIKEFLARETSVRNMKRKSHHKKITVPENAASAAASAALAGKSESDRVIASVKKKKKDAEKLIAEKTETVKAENSAAKTDSAPKKEKVSHSADDILSEIRNRTKKPAEKPAENTAETETAQAKPAKQTKSEKAAEKAAEKKAVSDMIAEAEDKIDDVEFSTRTISIDEIMRALEKQDRGEKKRK